MADDLEVLLGRAEGEDPSAEFVAALRRRIVDETGSSRPATPASGPTRDADPNAGPASIEDDPVGGAEDVEILELDRPPGGEARPPRWRPMMAAAAAIVVSVVAGALVVTRTATTVETTTEDSQSFDADAPLLTGDTGATLDPGTHLVDTVGTPFTFTSDVLLAVEVNRHGLIRIAHPEAQGDDDRAITFGRLTALSDPARLDDPPDGSQPSWPADDFGGWLDRVPRERSASNEIVVTGREEATLGGLPAIRADLAVGPVACEPPDEPCHHLGVNRSAHRYDLRSGSQYRVWVVDQGDHDPLVVVAAIDRASDIGWFDAVDALVGSLAFGSVGPNPILDSSATTSELPFLGGIRVELDATAVVADPAGFGRVVLADWEADTEFLADPRALDGEAIETTDELVAVLTAAQVEVSEIGATVIDGIDARVFDLSAEGSGPTLGFAAGGERAWRAPPRGRLWVMEHPDRGLLVVTAEVFENLDLVFPLVVAQTEAIIETLEFSEP